MADGTEQPSFTSPIGESYLEDSSFTPDSFHAHNDTCREPETSLGVIWSYTAFLLVVSILLNTALLFTVCYLKKGRRKPSHVLVGNLCVLDLTACVIYLPLLAASLTNCDIACTWLLPVERGMVAAIMWATTSISLDRYLFIVRHASYRNKLTPLRTKIGVCAIWGVGSVVAVTSLAVPPHPMRSRDYCSCNVSQYSYGFYSLLYMASYIVFCFVLPSVFTLVSYGFVIRVAYRHARLKNKSLLHSSVASRAPSSGSNSPALTQRTTRPEVKVHRVKTAKILVLVLGTHFLLVGPYFLLNLMNGSNMVGDADCELHVLSVWLSLLFFTNTAFNPVYYGFCSKRYRDPLVAFLKGGRKKGSVNSELAEPRRCFNSRLSIMADGSSASGRSSVASDISGFSRMSQEGFINRDLLKLYSDSVIPSTSNAAYSPVPSETSTVVIRRPLAPHQNKRSLALKQITDAAMWIGLSQTANTSEL